MANWFERLSIRVRVLLFGLVLLLPVVAVMAWLLTEDVQQARDNAYAQVRILATATAAQVQRTLAETEALLVLVAARPQVRALDAEHCDPVGDEFMLLQTGFLTLEVRDANGKLVCSSLKTPDGSLNAAEQRWFDQALRHGGFMVSGAARGHRTGKWIVVLGQPIRDDAGAVRGLVVLAVDLQALSDRLLASVPPGAVVTVADPTRALLMRSAQAASLIGTRPPAGESDPAEGRREGTLDTVGRDGVSRLFAFVTLPVFDWRVAASVPRDEVFAPYHATQARAVAIALGVLLLAGFMAMRLSRAIVDPIVKLRRATARVAAGEEGVRAPLVGPPDIRALAEQINAMLDAKAGSDARLRGIFESTVDAIITADEAQRIVQVNPAAAAMFGCSSADMLGLPLERFVPAAQREQHRGDVAAFGHTAAAARHMGATREVMALRFDGQEFPIEASISWTRVAGHLLYTVIHRDISERREAHDALVAGKRQLQAALASMSDAVLITDSTGQFLEFNRAFVEFHRYKDVVSCPREVAACATLLELRGADGRVLATTEWPVARALRGESVADAEFSLRRKDTGAGWIANCSFAPVRAEDGSIVGAVVVSRDVTAQREAQSDLEASHHALQQFIARQDSVQEQERMRIARDLHDDLQQTLAAIRIDLSELGGLIEPASTAPGPLLSELDGLAEQAVLSTRRIVDDLRPRMLEDLGLVPALQALASQFMQRTSIACVLEAPEELGEAIADQPELATCLYRVAQEALNNVAKHAQASRVAIRLVQTLPNRLVLRVLDDGRGMSRKGRGRADAFGILGMQERLRAQGGTLQISPAAAGGTLLEAMVPLGSTSAAEGPRPPADALAFGNKDATPLPRLLGRTARQALQNVIDALDGPAVVLDGLGVVRYANRAWTAGMGCDGGPIPAEVGPGADYLEVCRRSCNTDASVRPILQGLSDLLEGRLAHFHCVYPCHTPVAQQWFRLHAAPMSNGDVLVTHVLLRREDQPVGAAVD